MVDQAKFPNLDGLTELANRDGVDIKPALLRVMTDLYVQKPVHSAEEERHYTELALRLVDRVDASTRAIVAGRLANYAAAPRSVVQRLARKGHEKGHELDKTTPSLMAETAVASADPFAGGKVAAHELSELFLATSAAERRLILLNLEYAPLPPAAPIDPQTAREAVTRLEIAALGHNTEVFAQEIERTLGLAREHARRLIDDESGEPIVVFAIALAMPADVLQRILLCLNPVISQSVLRVYELATLHEEIEPQAALRLLAIWRATHRPAQRPAAHAPQYWHVETNERSAPTARPAIRWDEHSQARKAEGS